MDLNDSYPAVSHICTFTFVSSFIAIVLEPKSTPMVRSCASLNLLSVNWSSRQDLPTLDSPTMMYLKM